MRLMNYVLPAVLLLIAPQTIQAQEQSQEVTEEQKQEITQLREGMNEVPFGIAENYFKDAQYDSAIDYYKKEINFLREKGVKPEDCKIYAQKNYNLAISYKEKKNFKKALKHLYLAEVYFERDKHLEGIIDCYLNYSLISKEKGNLDDAMKMMGGVIFLKKTEIKYTKEFSIEEFINNQKELSKYYKMMGDLLEERGDELMSVEEGSYESGYDFYTKSIMIDLALEDIERYQRKQK